MRIIRNEFTAILIHFGLKEIEAHDGYIKFNKKTISVVFSYDYNRGKDLDFYITTDICEYSFELPELQNALVIESAKNFEYNKWVSCIKELIALHGEKLFKPDYSFYKQMCEKKKEQTAQYNKQRELKQKINEADKAWTAKKYKDFLSILHPYEEELSEAYRKKLLYAKSR